MTRVTPVFGTPLYCKKCNFFFCFKFCVAKLSSSTSDAPHPQLSFPSQMVTLEGCTALRAASSHTSQFKLAVNFPPRAGVDAEVQDLPCRRWRWPMFCLHSGDRVPSTLRQKATDQPPAQPGSLCHRLRCNPPCSDRTLKLCCRLRCNPRCSDRTLKL